MEEDGEAVSEVLSIRRGGRRRACDSVKASSRVPPEKRAERERERASEGGSEKSEEGVLDAGVCGLPPATEPPLPCPVAADMATELGSATCELRW